MRMDVGIGGGVRLEAGRGECADAKSGEDPCELHRRE